ncbi:DNA-binding CsgD family transcriptional regulator [Allocatelliglobosispora scoriae]|uniref:DNA-binding CsgD family transcriptional regulator n=1 Tax=Allocatelliglobosispora scoriae TaxID=643052 RepID=A0A841BZH7_9ACTN|nr:LuxR family transcriptional regulator [Allocatelliglobosispora scoriae]MBB5872898.1 DNA-binding CsgD family transcriptional regulator [Allocatelliglobosispora scoriae]
MPSLLEPVGLAQIHSDLYLDLLSHPRSTPTDLAARQDLPVARVRKALQRLLDTGLAARLVGSRNSYVAAPPEIAVDALVLRRSKQLEQLRIDAHELALRVRSVLPPAESSELIQLVEGPEAVSHHLARMQLGAREEVLIIDSPPYLYGRPVANAEEMQALARGVSYRALYDAPGLHEAGHVDQMMECVAAGEQARTLPSIRMKMIIADRDLALLPISFSAGETGTRILVHASPLLDALVLCFESLWAQATPIGVTATTSEGVSDQDRRLLSMLASGFKDRAIARALGVTERTVGRRIQELMAQLHATTRFQAGLSAARRGWL